MVLTGTEEEAADELVNIYGIPADLLSHTRFHWAHQSVERWIPGVPRADTQQRNTLSQSRQNKVVHKLCQERV